MFVLFKKKTDLPEKELISLFKQTGDERYFNQLFNKYSHLVFGSCIKYLSDEEQAKDAVLEIFEKLASDFKNHNVEHFPSWLYMVTRNHCLMKLRKLKTEANKFEEYKLGQDTFMENGIMPHLNGDTDKEVLLSQMEACLGSLESNQKKCVEDFYLKKQSYQQLSTALGYDLNKVKSYIQNGKRNLKICIETALKAA